MALPRSGEVFFLHHGIGSSKLEGDPFLRPIERDNPWVMLHPPEWGRPWFVRKSPTLELRKIVVFQEVQTRTNMIDRAITLLLLPPDHAVASYLEGHHLHVNFGEIPVNLRFLSRDQQGITANIAKVTYEGLEWQTKPAKIPWTRSSFRTVASGPSDVL